MQLRIIYCYLEYWVGFYGDLFLFLRFSHYFHAFPFEFYGIVKLAIGFDQIYL